MSILNTVYGKGKDFDYLTYRPERFNLSCSVRIRSRPTEKHKMPFLEVCRKREDWAGVVWRTPNNRKVSVVTIEDEPRLYFTYCGYKLQPELVAWVKLNKEALLNYWFYQANTDEEATAIERAIENLIPLSI